MTASLLGQLDQTLRGVWRRVRQRLRRRTVKDRLAPVYLKGRGLEIGALHNPLRVSSRAKVRYVDRLPVAELRAHYPDLRDKKLVRVDVVDDGERLDTVGTATQDFEASLQVPIMHTSPGAAQVLGWPAQLPSLQVSPMVQ